VAAVTAVSRSAIAQQRIGLKRHLGEHFADKPFRSCTNSGHLALD
jgi:hypothetical protein